MSRDVDVVVLGLGPAGRAAASACAAQGLRVLAIDPAPHRRWRATYAAWSDEISDTVPLVARIEHPAAWTTHRHVLERAYCVLDPAALQQTLSLQGVEIRATTATTTGRHEVRTADGLQVRTRLTLDARGATTIGRIQQVAHGVMVGERAARPLLGEDAAVFMDWRRAPETSPDADPSFLYAVPVHGQRVLLEETSLAGAPGPSRTELRSRLMRRLAVHRVELTGDEQVEDVRFALDTPLPAAEWLGRTPDVPRLGAAAPLIHPATGFSVATSLALAPRIARAATEDDPAVAVQRVLWPTGARAVHALRRWGLRVLMGLTPDQVPEFFAAFLEISAQHQAAYLTTRDCPSEMATAMSAMLPAVSWPLRRAMISGH